MSSTWAKAWTWVRSRRSGLALLGLAALHVAATLLLSGGWRFGKYPALAAALRAGALSPAEVSDASPGYLLLALCCGSQPLRWLQALAGGAAIVLVQRVGARLNGPAAGWAAALVLAVAQPWLVYSAVLEPDLLIGVLGLAGVAALVSAAPAGTRAVSLAGGALGFAIALRPSAALLGLVALGWLAWERRGRRRLALGHAVAFAASLAAAAWLPLAALHLATDHPWRATMSAGQVFHQGHRPEGSGLGATFPVLLKTVELLDEGRPGHRPDRAHQLYRRLAEAAAGMALTPEAAERYWIERALAFARAEPWAFARQLGRKLVFFAAASGTDADVPEAAALLQRSEPWSVPLGWISLAGLAGLLLAIGRRGAIALIAAWLLCGAASASIFYVQARYALAIVPAWCLLAGFGVAELAEARRRPARLVRLALVAALPLALLAPSFVRDQRRLDARLALVPVRSEADALRRAGRQVEAAEAYRDELAAFPEQVLPFARHGYGLDADDPGLALRAAERARARFGEERPADLFLLGALLAAGGRCDLALPLVDRAAAAGFHGAVADVSLDPDLLASDCLLAAGRPSSALERVRRSLERWPGTLDGLARAVAATRAMGDGELARWEAALQALHDPASAHHALARARRRWGDAAGALAEADWLATRLPEAAPLAQFERAQALLDLGRVQEALQAYALSLASRVYLPGTRRFDAPFRALLAERPDSRAVQQVALSHWSRRGSLDEVRALLARHAELARPDAAP